MRETKIKNRNSGITLIALVITIIVMLILVAVTINMAINGGLFNYAKKATGDMENAMDKEQQLANGEIEIGGKKYNSIDEYLEDIGAGGAEPEHEWKREGDTFTCQKHSGEVYEMGQQVVYTATGNSTATITAQKSGLDRYYADKGSYPTDANLVETEEGTTSRSSLRLAATIAPSTDGTQGIERQDTSWVVLGIEDTNEDGKYETLLITTESFVGATADKGVYLYGAASYNNGPSELKRICKELYSNSEYGEARSMTIEDVNAALKYTPVGGLYMKSDSKWYTTGNLTTTLGNLPIFSSIVGDSGVAPTSTDASSTDNTEEQPANPLYTPASPDTPVASSELAKYPLDGYAYGLDDEGRALINLVNDSTSSITETERTVVFGPSKNYVYWLASRGVVAIPELAIFCPGFVLGDYAYSCLDVSVGFDSDGFELGGALPLRPVVSLTSKLPALQGPK